MINCNVYTLIRMLKEQPLPQLQQIPQPQQYQLPQQLLQQLPQFFGIMI